MDIVFIATEWGSRGGGLNTLNTSLATSLSVAVEAARVACVVSQATPAEIADAGAKGVLLLSLNQDEREVLDGRCAEAVKSLLAARNIGPSWLVGHDVKTGWAAVGVAKLMSGSSAFVIHHMSYRDYADLKVSAGTSDDSKAQEQAQLFKLAERVGAVGPLLHDRLKDFARSDGYLLVPGLDELQVSETRPNQTLRCVITGRLDAEHDALKQTSLVVHAFAEAVRRAESGRSGADRIASLDVVGVSEHDGAVDKLRREAEEIANRRVNIQFFPFSSDRDVVLSRVRNSNLFLFLSTHDGFGLSAWEAIGLGIPVLLSKNTGIHRLLSGIGPSVRSLFRSVEIRGTTAKKGRKFLPEDREVVASAILDAAQEIPVNLECATNLRNLLLTQRGYSWGLITQSLCKYLGVAAKPLRVQTPTVRVLRDTGGDLLSSAFVRGTLDLAEQYNRVGRYQDALGITEALLAKDGLSPEDKDRVLAAAAESHLRLNDYSAAMRLVKELRASSDATMVFAGLVIENTIARDLDDVPASVDTAMALSRLAEVGKSPKMRGQACRKRARSFAKADRCDEALLAADEAIQLARETADPILEAQSFLAKGEALRYSFRQTEASDAYARAIQLSKECGHPDCFLWAALGLADSHFLGRRLKESRELLDWIRGVIATEGRRYPLETLHADLSLLALEIAEAARTPAILRGHGARLLEAYSSMGIRWPSAYLDALFSSNQDMPRRL